ncbi:hypothetical protein NHX12_030190 [Muraenolepis orangiensis]|uniref:Uncharacterized protein n=1 Tax=Muraenolepis orangiensis TaxID=630683 RepID=A0A9Q0EBL3_9TELE|nr:hypothetical protein NHX12_030190 [Muraenolepis orangiensis]
MMDLSSGGLSPEDRSVHGGSVLWWTVTRGQIRPWMDRLDPSGHPASACLAALSSFLQFGSNVTLTRPP